MEQMGDASTVSGSLLKGRNWLALRLLAVSFATNAFMWWLLDNEQANQVMDGLPKWMEILIVLPVLAGFFGLFVLLTRGIPDFLNHSMAEGKWKTRLLEDKLAAIASAKDFQEIGPIAAYAPFWVIALYVVIVIVAALALGGIAALSSLWGTVSGWPSWAVVITILLVMILLKRDKAQR
jgi:hypothetical protein